MLCITLGTCGRRSVSGRSVRWARVDFGQSGGLDAGWGLTHHCAVHHIDEWPELAKTFGDSERTARLSFTPCQLAPEATLVLHLELEGTVYEKLRRDNNVHFPPSAVVPAPPQSARSATSSLTASGGTPPPSALPKSRHRTPPGPEAPASSTSPTIPAAPRTHLVSSSASASGTLSFSHHPNRRGTKRCKSSGGDGTSGEKVRKKLR